mmetsp:Transcript_10840/g.33233  ORF Transcript_10840/g.33233 Transcript_10840/m.33233 type:complete len:296 (+) Transcript_10840:106-993(+)
MDRSSSAHQACHHRSPQLAQPRRARQHVYRLCERPGGLDPSGHLAPAALGLRVLCRPGPLSHSRTHHRGVSNLGFAPVLTPVRLGSRTPAALVRRRSAPEAAFHRHRSSSPALVSAALVAVRLVGQDASQSLGGRHRLRHGLSGPAAPSRIAALRPLHRRRADRTTEPAAARSSQPPAPPGADSFAAASDLPAAGLRARLDPSLLCAATTPRALLCTADGTCGSLSPRCSTADASQRPALRSLSPGRTELRCTDRSASGTRVSTEFTRHTVLGSTLYSRGAWECGGGGEAEQRRG